MAVVYVSWWCRTGSCSARLMHTPTPLALGVLVVALYRITASSCRWYDEKSHHRSTTSHRPCLSTRSSKEPSAPPLHEEEHPTTAATEKKEACGAGRGHASHVVATAEALADRTLSLICSERTHARCAPCLLVLGGRTALRCEMTPSGPCSHAS